MNKRSLFSFWLFFVLFPSTAEETPPAVVSSSTYRNDEKIYITTGESLFTLQYEDIQPTLTEFHRYKDWMLAGLDGRDPVSAKFIGQLTGIEYVEGNDILTVEFTVNLPWPFGSKGNRLPFSITKDTGGRDLHLFFSLNQNSAVLSRASLDLTLSPRGSETYFTFEAQVKFSWIIGLFFSETLYKKNIEWRIMKLIENIVLRVSGRNRLDPKEADF